jgi:hypothetical protein
MKLHSQPFHIALKATRDCLWICIAFILLSCISLIVRNGIGNISLKELLLALLPAMVYLTFNFVVTWIMEAVTSALWPHKRENLENLIENDLIFALKSAVIMVVMFTVPVVFLNLFQDWSHTSLLWYAITLPLGVFCGAIFLRRYYRGLRDRARRRRTGAVTD